MKKSLTIFTTILLSILIAGCEKVPIEKIEAAKKAINEAKKAEASRYAPKELKASEETFSKALAEIHLQNKKVIGKDYKKASRLLREVTTLAHNAVKTTEELKARTKLEATKDAAETTINRVYAAYKRAKKSGKNAAVLAQVMDLLKQAQLAMKEGRYQDAVDAAKQANEKL